MPARPALTEDATQARLVYMTSRTRVAEPLTAPQRPAIGAPKQKLHLHFHGVTAEDVAAIIQREQGE
jgi:hypothetical protein